MVVYLKQTQDWRLGVKIKNWESTIICFYLNMDFSDTAGFEL